MSERQTDGWTDGRTDGETDGRTDGRTKKQRQKWCPQQKRYRCIKCKTCRYSRGFVPVAIRMLNAK